MSSRRLSPQKIAQISQRLDTCYPRTELHNREDPLEEAIFIILSSQTDEGKYVETWRAFSNTFPTLESAYLAEHQDVYEAIRRGGLGAWKATRIKNLLRQVLARYDELSLDSLSVLEDTELERELVGFDGISIKSARCIMMYSFGRQVFPVDVHVARIVNRLGFRIPRAGIRTRKYADSIQEQVLPSFRHRLHVNLLQHGRAVCRPRNPRCAACEVRGACRTYERLAKRG